MIFPKDGTTYMLLKNFRPLSHWRKYGKTQLIHQQGTIKYALMQSCHICVKHGGVETWAPQTVIYLPLEQLSGKQIFSIKYAQLKRRGRPGSRKLSVQQSLESNCSLTFVTPWRSRRTNIRIYLWFTDHMSEVTVCHCSLVWGHVLPWLLLPLRELSLKTQKSKETSQFFQMFISASKLQREISLWRKHWILLYKQRTLEPEEEIVSFL